VLLPVIDPEKVCKGTVAGFADIDSQLMGL
jgi:hypothetical protein